MKRGLDKEQAVKSLAGDSHPFWSYFKRRMERPLWATFMMNFRKQNKVYFLVLEEHSEWKKGVRCFTDSAPIERRPELNSKLNTMRDAARRDAERYARSAESTLAAMMAMVVSLTVAIIIATYPLMSRTLSPTGGASDYFVLGALPFVLYFAAFFVPIRPNLPNLAFLIAGTLASWYAQTHAHDFAAKLNAQIEALNQLGKVPPSLLYECASYSLLAFALGLTGGLIGRKLLIRHFSLAFSRVEYRSFALATSIASAIGPAGEGLASAQSRKSIRRDIQRLSNLIGNGLLDQDDRAARRLLRPLVFRFVRRMTSLSDWVLSPVPSTANTIRGDLLTIAHCAESGQWGQLPLTEPPKLSTKERVTSTLLIVMRVSLPAILILIFVQTHLIADNPPLLRGVTSLWAVYQLLKLLDPDLKESIANMKELPTILSGLRDKSK